jgi:iron(III) transport system permease protein
VRRTLTPLHLVAGLAAVVAVSPLVYLGVRTYGAGWSDVAAILARPRTWELSVASLGLAASVAATCIAVGVPLAWLITRTAVPGGRLWLVIAALPLAVPSYVAAYTWLAAFPGLQGFAPAWAVLSLVSLPYVVLPVAAVLAQIDPGYDDVARTLGSGPLRSFHRTTVPLLAPAAGAGGLLTALYVLSDFGAVSLLRFDTFTRVIYTSYRASFDRTSAAVLSLVLVALALVFVMLERSLRTRNVLWRTGAGTARRPQRIPLGRWKWPVLAGLVALFGLAVGFPAAMLVGLMTVSRRADVDAGAWLAATANTVQAAGIGALIAVALALPIGVLAARYRDRWTRAVESTAFISHALPGVVVGLSLVYLGLAVVPGLYQTLVMLGFAYAVLFLSNAIGSIRSATGQVSQNLEDVARTLGAGPTSAWLRVTARVSLPGIIAGALLVLLTAMKELPATLMLRPTGFDTLATEMWTQTVVGSFSGAAPYAFGLVLLAAVPAFVLARLSTTAEPVRGRARR